MRFTLAWLILPLALLYGCTPAIRGAPTGSLHEVAEVAAKIQDAAAKDLLECEDQACSDEVVMIRMMLIDQRYAEFVLKLRQSKTRSDLIGGIAGLAVGLAGTLADSAGAKTNYSTVGTLISGSDAITNQVLYYEQTVIALISAMDANRAQSRLNLKTLQKGGTAAADDLYAGLVAYERAGTLMGAIAYVQSTAEQARGVSEDAIRAIYPLSTMQLNKKLCVTNSLVPNPALNVGKLQAAVAALAIAVPADKLSDGNTLRLALRQYNRDADPEQVETIFSALQSQGLLGSCASTVGS